MGSSQSQEEREVTVEEDPSLEQGAFRVTEGFVGYLKDKVVPEREGEEGEDEDEEDDDEEADVSDIRAESITAPLRGDFSGEHKRSRGSTRGRGLQDTPEGGASSTESLHWKEKFETEKAKNEILKTVTSREFDSVVGEVRDKLNRQVPQLVPACENFKEKVSDCYLGNPGRPLTCREEVKAYMVCVQRVQRGERPDTTSSSANSTSSPPPDKSEDAKTELPEAPILPQPS